MKSSGEDAVADGIAEGDGECERERRLALVRRFCDVEDGDVGRFIWLLNRQRSPWPEHWIPFFWHLRHSGSVLSHLKRLLQHS